MNDRIFDVAVVGGGPAGTIFTAELAHALPTLKIALIDGQNEKRRKVCGGLLSPDAQKVLARLGLTLPKEVLSDPQIFDVVTIDLEKRLTRRYQRHYLNMDRYAFDRWLLSFLPKEVEQIGGRCTEISYDSGLARLSVNTDQGKQEISARYVVGADGASSVVRKKLFSKSPYKYVSIQQHFRCDAKLLPPYSCVFDPATSDSCSWTIRKDGYVIFGGAFKAKGCREAYECQRERFEAFIGAPFGEAKKTEACLVSSPRTAKDLVLSDRNGKAFLIGEAAGFISSSSFEGISYAMLSGKLLAEAFCESSPKEIKKAYEKKTRKMRLKLRFKIFKRAVLCSPFLRRMIMKSGIASMKRFEE